MTKKFDLLLAFLTIPTDAVAIFLAFVASYVIRGNSSEVYQLPYGEYLNMVALSLPLWLAIFAIQGLYQIRTGLTAAANVSRVAVATLAGWAFFIVYMAFLKTQETFVFPRLMLVYILALSFVFVLVGRFGLRVVRVIANVAGVGKRRVLVVTTNGDDISVQLTAKQNVGLELVDVLKNPSAESLGKAIKSGRIDEVVLDNRTQLPHEMSHYLRVIDHRGAVAHIVPNTFEVQSSNVLFSTLAGIPVLTLRPTPLEGWGRIVKRAVDVVVAGLAIIVLSPIYLATMLAIKLTDPGPVFYSQPRVARGLKKFTIYKFRTMDWKYCTHGGPSPKSVEQIMIEDFHRPDLAEEYKKTRKIKNDPRISPLGKFLRRTNIDELPQLYNVVKGDISLVGPRPYLEEEIDYSNAQMLSVFTIKPGLTGLWQVSGRNEATFEERIRLDYYYVQNWSLWHDVTIVLKTAWMLMRGSRGAY